VLHYAECSTQSLPVNLLHTMPVMSLSFWHQLVALGVEGQILGLQSFTPSMRL